MTIRTKNSKRKSSKINSFLNLPVLPPDNITNKSFFYVNIAELRAQNKVKKLIIYPAS
jgi:hypothetical protein